MRIFFEHKQTILLELAPPQHGSAVPTGEKGEIRRSPKALYQKLIYDTAMLIP
jgi:hypothetical protein